MHHRLSKLINALEKKGLGALAVTKIENVRYLSGFTGSNAVAVVSAGASVLITDGRYREQAHVETPSWEIVIYKGEIAEAVAEALHGAESIGFETSASFELVENLRTALPDKATLQPVKDIVEGIRMCKDEVEISLIHQALECASRAFGQIVPLIRPGVTEREIAAELDYRMMLAGAEGPAFDTEVASGPHSSMPHASFTDRVLSEGDLVVIDFGVRRNGYCTDTSRTLVVGEPDERQEDLLEAVKEASDAALAALKPGIQASEVDQAARRVIAEKGFAGNFSHGLGHGVGLEVHEKPTISALSKDVLQPGVVFTIEPGIYIEGWGGVRHEEMLLMTSAGMEVLSRNIPDR